ncbi:MAG: cell wall-binding repeat-containing protein [Euzebya sp.]
MFLVAAMLAALLPGPIAGAQGADRIGRADDPISAAIDISQATFAAGSADYVILGRDDVFADNLGGAALAGLPSDRLGGPLLFTEGGPEGRPTEAIVEEINRVLGPGDGCEQGDPVDVYILGGTDAVSNITGEGLVEGSGYCDKRLAGTTRIETAVAVAEELGGPNPDQVLLARSDEWADSATGGAYAAATGSPILVTQPGSLAQPVQDYLTDHTPGEIVLLGGTAALSPTVADQAATYAPVRRIAGDARDLTAIAIAEDLWGTAIEGVTLVPGYDPDGWAFALAGAVPAAAAGWPEVYTQPDVLTGSTRDFLAASGATGVLAVGSTNRISDGVLAEAAQATGIAPPPPSGPPGRTPFAYAVHDRGVHYFDANQGDIELQTGPARGDLTWAPDGTALAIAFADGEPEGPEGFDEAGDIVVVAPEGDPFFDLRASPSLQFTQPVWAPDGHQELAVVGVDPGTSRVLYQRFIGGQTAGSLFPLTAPEDGFVSLESPQAWSPDGTRIAVTLDGEIAIVDISADTITRLGVDGVAPAWSPDGQALAYTTASRSYVIELGDDPAAATPTDVGPIAGTQPVWLDNSQILLAGENTSDQTNAVWRLHRDGSQPTFEAAVQDPAITADLAADGGDLGIVSGELGAVVLTATSEFGFATSDHVTDLRFQPQP